MWLLLLLPPLFFFQGREGANHPIYTFSISLFSEIGKQPHKLIGRPCIPWIVLPLFFFILALARPQWTKNHVKHHASGVDIVIAIDVSLSMSINDFSSNQQTINRLEAARETAKYFISNRPNDRIGVIGFAGQPYKVTPITLSHSFLPALIDREIIISDDVTPGTAIGSAIASSANLIDTTAKDSKSKIIILITDGSSNSGKIAPLEAAKLAKDLGIKIYTLAIGTKHGRLPSRTMNAPMQEFDTETLKKVAEITEGQYYRAQHFSALAASFEAIDKLEKVETKTTNHREIMEFHHWFNGIGLLFLILILSVEALWQRNL